MGIYIYIHHICVYEISPRNFLEKMHAASPGKAMRKHCGLHGARQAKFQDQLVESVW